MSSLEAVSGRGGAQIGKQIAPSVIVTIPFDIAENWNGFAVFVHCVEVKNQFPIEVIPENRSNSKLRGNIILWNFTPIGLHFLFQEIHRELFLEECITFV